MRKVIASNLVSLDSFFEGPNQELNWFSIDEEFLGYSRGLLRSVDTILFGRVTYQYMASYWPSAPRDENADRMNSLNKIVFSRSLRTVEWSKGTDVASIDLQTGQLVRLFNPRQDRWADHFRSAGRVL
jgi:dihydrofolate reductase